MIEKFSHTKLPYLPKVLRVAKALPLQLHPVYYRHAFLEHLTNPKYRTRTLRVNPITETPQTSLAPTINPKSPLSTEFEAFCGPKPLDIIDRLMELPSLQVFLPQVKKLESDDQTLKYIVKRMLEASDEVIRKTNDALMQLPKEAFDPLLALA